MARLIKWHRENTLKHVVPNKSGIYRLYNRQKNLIYVGHARHLRHRIQSYQQKDSYREHPTKKVVRKKIAWYSFTPMPVQKARRIERKVKHRAPFNYL